MSSQAPLTILLTGGIASGKSTIASLLAKKGAVVLDADKLAHEQLARPEVAREVEKAFGTADRKKLGQIVFGDQEKLRRLEGILHPLVLAAMAERLRDLAGKPSSVAVLDVPLAAEAGVKADLTLFVDASLETRRERARTTRGWAEGELERRESRQLSPEEKRQLADAVVSNDRGVAEAERDVERIWKALVEPRLEGSR
ncbi:MAG TPA: dephospho-CoA kinase [Planctomycetota bacterium]|nr:dephospho-CoA kinase [Planctomycetota bacterium]